MSCVCCENLDAAATARYTRSLVSDVRPEIVSFAWLMEQKLRQSDVADADEREAEQMVTRLMASSRELVSAMRRKSGVDVIRREAAGLATDAMKIASFAERVDGYDGPDVFELLKGNSAVVFDRDGEVVAAVIPGPPSDDIVSRGALIAAWLMCVDRDKLDVLVAEIFPSGAKS